MTSGPHPNRSTWLSSLPVPGPDEIRAARGTMTQYQAAEAAGLSGPVRWAHYESGARRPSAAIWELFLLRTGQHPTHVLIAR